MSSTSTSLGPHTPAALVVHRFGGCRALAKLLQISPSAVSRWNKPRSEGGTDGLIPSRKQHAILQAARDKGLDLTADDLIGQPQLRTATDAADPQPQTAGA
jgi:hypothetical protein